VTATCYGYTKGYRKSNANGHPHTDCNTGAYFNANLTRATLTDANLTGAILTGADLTGAYLTNATLTNATLTEADLTNATMPGFKDSQPTSLKDAAQKTKDWLSGGHWVHGSWIQTPKGAYEGSCFACLHGAAVYVGGPFGPELSDKLRSLGYTESWNDDHDRGC